jgi:predicted TIM-barrel fold metal-dependent hydrolase
VPQLVAYMEKRKEPPYAYRKGGEVFFVTGEWHRRARPHHADVDAKLESMDQNGIDVTALSTNDPGPERFGEDGKPVAQMINDYLAEIAKKHPDRFLPLMVLPLQNMDAALEELERCVKRLGMKGLLLYSNLNGEFPDHPRYRPVFARAAELRLPIFLHPAYPVTYEQTKGYSMTGGLGLMFDTTIALARIILAGVLDEFPSLKLVCPHVGGTLPYLIGRIDHQTQVLQRGAERISRKPSEYLRTIYLDTVTPLPLAMRYAYDLVGPDHLIFGSDHPWVDPKLTIDNLKSLKLPMDHEQRIFGRTAEKLFDR